MLMFFVKQKTAYAMRMSDWSSDVCSSDLRLLFKRRPQPLSARSRGPLEPPDRLFDRGGGRSSVRAGRGRSRQELLRHQGRPAARARMVWHGLCRCPEDARSEEHTSELQSLMRISYAVFCLKKKNQQESSVTNI